MFEDHSSRWNGIVLGTVESAKVTPQEVQIIYKKNNDTEDEKWNILVRTYCI